MKSTGGGQDQARAVDINRQVYEDYYAKPWWWFSLRYDTQIKRKTCLHLLDAAGVLGPNLRVLEIGFGSGAVLFSLDRSCELWGLEVSRSAIESARHRAARRGYAAFRFEEYSGGPFPSPAGAFDAVICSHVLEHVPDDAELLRQIRAALRPGGHAVLVVPINERYEDRNHVRQYTPQSLEETVVGAGFSVVSRLQNEVLFVVMERIHFEGLPAKLRWLSPLVRLGFNLPTSQLPFGVCRALDRGLELLGHRPRQCALLVRRPEDV